MVEQIVQITKTELARLRKRELELTCLENAGVDNWEGYETAMEAYQEAAGIAFDKKE